MTTKELDEKYGDSLWQIQENEEIKRKYFPN